MFIAAMLFVAMWQEWVVMLILAVCVGWIVVNLSKKIQQSKKNISPCDGCSSDCKLRGLGRNHSSSCHPSPKESEEKPAKKFGGSKKNRTFATANEKQGRLQDFSTGEGK